MIVETIKCGIGNSTRTEGTVMEMSKSKDGKFIEFSFDCRNAEFTPTNDEIWVMCTMIPEMLEKFDLAPREEEEEV